MVEFVQRELELKVHHVKYLIHILALTKITWAFWSSSQRPFSSYYDK